MEIQTQKNLSIVREWRKDIFQFADECLNMRPAEPIDELRGKVISYRDSVGRPQTTILFDIEGRLVYHDLAFYSVDMFKNQSRENFKKYHGTRFTWQQTVKLEAYNRAINTFNKDSYDITKRWITIRSGHGVGKTSSSAIIAIHFLLCYFGSNVGVTATTEDQLKDIFLKEINVWVKRLPENLRGNLDILDTFIRIKNEKDWYLRARVASKENSQALAGLHANWVLMLVDECSGVDRQNIEAMKGSLTGENYVVIYDGNPTKNEGDFYDSHKPNSSYTRLHFNARHSPIVKEGSIEKWEMDYPSNGSQHSDTVKIRVDGEFAGVAEMDSKGWIPLFTNVRILFEPEQGQIIPRGIIGVDPAGRGRDRSIVHIRDNVYLKEVLNETTSSSPDLARKIETIRDAYHSKSNDIAVEAFGIGAQVVANIRTPANESANAVLTDKPREETKEVYHTYRSELGWLFREWCAKGGIIITNKKLDWIKELEKVKYKRDGAGRITLMDKVTFKKEYGFSPDRFDAACMTFFKEHPTMPTILTKAQLEEKDNAEWLQRLQTHESARTADSFSSM